MNELCLDKDAEVNTCQGSCHLKAELNKSKNTNSPSEDISFQELEILQWFEEDNLGTAELFLTEKENLLCNDLSILAGYTSILERPPRA